MATTSDAEEKLAVFSRSTDALLEIPWKYRWEFTRRHPYYLCCWHLALAHFEGHPAEIPELETIRYYAVLMLSHIGVTASQRIRRNLLKS
jgi:hypothetical protein